MNRRDQKKLPNKSPQMPNAPRAGERGESIVWRFIAVYLLLVLIGFIVFRHPATMVRGNELSVDRAMFTSINAVTLTGFQQTVAVDEYRWPGKIAALLLTIGGTLTTLVAGGMAVSRVARLGWSDRTIVIVACVAELVVISAGTFALLGRGRDGFEALFLAVSAFGNSGLQLGALPQVDSGRTHLVLMPLALAGGLGIPVLLMLGTMLRRRTPLPAYVRLALALWAGSYVVGLVVLMLLSSGGRWRDTLSTASVQAINSRTTGLPFPMADGRPAHWALMVLMAVGGISGGAAGGIKLTTLWKLFTGTRAALRGETPGPIFGIAITWVGLYFLLALVTLLCLLATEPGQPGDRLLFLVISAVSNVGLAQNPVSIVKGGMFVLSAAMLLGRILPLAILWWVVAVVPEGDELPVG
ncbi:MAG TPA: hypothetical protein VGR35_05695 [Tepidisphaeraceae bacterium]|nr:hypothetical protein [Tepidisphaeraceae bacterium]